MKYVLIGRMALTDCKWCALDVYDNKDLAQKAYKDYSDICQRVLFRRRWDA